MVKRSAGEAAKTWILEIDGKKGGPQDGQWKEVKGGSFMN